MVPRDNLETWDRVEGSGVVQDGGGIRIYTYG